MRQTTHFVKTDPEVFDAEKSGIKPFMFRKNDRGYKVGDIIVSQKTRHTGVEMSEGYPLIYTKDILVAEITYIFSGPFYTLPEGSVIIAFKVMEKDYTVGGAL